jgi:hypothetical protein
MDTAKSTNQRPFSVTVMSVLMMAAGALGFVYHIREINLHYPFQNDVMWVVPIQLIAIVCGVYMFLGHNWARWLTIVWLGFHVVAGGLHSLGQFAFHAVLFVMIAYILFRRPEADYFRVAKV